MLNNHSVQSIAVRADHTHVLDSKWRPTRGAAAAAPLRLFSSNEHVPCPYIYPYSILNRIRVAFTHSHSRGRFITYNTCSTQSLPIRHTRGISRGTIIIIINYIVSYILQSNLLKSEQIPGEINNYYTVRED